MCAFSVQCAVLCHLCVCALSLACKCHLCMFCHLCVMSPYCVCHISLECVLSLECIMSLECVVTCVLSLLLSLVLSLVLCLQCKALETVVSVMEKLESELAIRSSNVQSFKVDVTDPSVLTRLKGECGSVGTCAHQCWQPLLSPCADKSEGGRFAQEIRHIAHKLDDYCDTLVLDVQKRVDLVSMLIECRLANSRKLPACRQLLMVRCSCVYVSVCG